MEELLEMEQFAADDEAEFEYLAYRGTLSDMCKFIGISSGNSRTNQKLKAAIDALEADGLLK